MTSAMPRYASPAYKAAARHLVYALTLGDEWSWQGLSIILRAGLSDQERAALAFTALKSLDRKYAVLTAETALAEGAGQPIAPLLNYTDEAVFWADMASDHELDAYCLASFNRMAPSRQAAFLGFVRGRAAA